VKKNNHISLTHVTHVIQHLHSPDTMLQCGKTIFTILTKQTKIKKKTCYEPHFIDTRDTRDSTLQKSTILKLSKRLDARTYNLLSPAPASVDASAGGSGRSSSAKHALLAAVRST
jgi:hypothetical protein